MRDGAGDNRTGRVQSSVVGLEVVGGGVASEHWVREVLVEMFGIGGGWRIIEDPAAIHNAWCVVRVQNV